MGRGRVLMCRACAARVDHGEEPILGMAAPWLCYDTLARSQLLSPSQTWLKLEATPSPPCLQPPSTPPPMGPGS